MLNQNFYSKQTSNDFYYRIFMATMNADKCVMEIDEPF